MNVSKEQLKDAIKVKETDFEKHEAFVELQVIWINSLIAEKIDALFTDIKVLDSDGIDAMLEENPKATLGDAIDHLRGDGDAD